ncbi:hypothetical protein RND81_11G086200 [Saponaria officinalis]|uniref:Glycine-rich protein n=1 Tax=Saponaria officinalis TaxID=3572 RepID=A0AAW1HL73_SAPOF
MFVLLTHNKHILLSFSKKKMGSKYFLLFGLLAITLFITSESATSNADTEVKGVGDAKYGGYHGGGGGYHGGGGGYPGGGGGYHGGGGGGYPGGGGGYHGGGGGGYHGGGGSYHGGGGGYHGGGGGYCQYGCCGGHSYSGGCLKCCSLEAQVEAQPHH